jgi:hypothetical protein
MQKIASLAVIRGSAIVAAALMLLVCFAARSEAVVGDVTLTGLPPNSEISLKDETTGQTEKRQSDDRGVVIFSWGTKNSQAGDFTVTARNPSLFPGTPSRKVQLKDGNNRVDLTGLVSMAGGVGPRMPMQAFEFTLNARFFDGALKPIGTSAAIRLDYVPPIACCQDTFTLQPYAGVWGVPSVSIRNHLPYDFKGKFQAEVDHGSMVGLNAGVKHVSQYDTGGCQLCKQVLGDKAKIVGVAQAGIGWVHYDFHMQRLSMPQPNFVNANKFNDTDNAFRMEFNLGLGAKWENGMFGGLKGGFAPTFTEIFNGGTKTRIEGSLGVTLGYAF